MNVNLVRKSDVVDKAFIDETASKLNINPKLAELLFQRGLRDEEEIVKFLTPDEKNLYDPFLMKGMRAAVERLESAIENHEKVVVYGDYDADGVCAAAILSLYLTTRGLDVFVHIPNRVGEGYGLNVDSLGKIIEDIMPDLIVTVDCGISGYDEVEFVLDLGVDMIVTDHHEIGEKIPNCVILNPKQEDCAYPYNMLCGAGVALKLVQAMGGLDAMREYTDLACVATIADLMPLLDENRLIVQLGLKRIKLGKNLGLKALFESLSVDNLTSSEIAYKVAPRINAAGRMGDAYRAFTVLTSKDIRVVRETIDEINADNTRRKELCDEMYGEAVEDFAEEDFTAKAIIMSHPSWERGITGIVAARLCGDFNRPTFIMVGSGEGVYKGTCRSINGINIHEILSKCKDCLVEYGGHSQAAGFSIKTENIPVFKEKVNELLAEYDDELFLPSVSYDLELDSEEITNDLVDAFELMEPIGNGNPRPLVLIKEKSLKISPCKNANHISILTNSGLQIFAFSFSKQSYQLLGSGVKNLVIELQQSLYGGKMPKGILKACQPSELFVNDEYASAYKYEAYRYIKSSAAEYIPITVDKMTELASTLYGTLFIANDYKAYREFIAKYPVMFNEYMFSSQKNNYTKVIVAPELEDKSLMLSLYDNVVFLSKPLTDGVVGKVKKKAKHATIYVCDTQEQADSVVIDKSICAKYYEALRQVNMREFSSIFAIFKHIRSTMSDITYAQFTICLSIFAELDIVSVDYSPATITLEHGKSVKLEDSKIFAKFSR